MLFAVLLVKFGGVSTLDHLTWASATERHVIRKHWSVSLRNRPLSAAAFPQKKRHWTVNRQLRWTKGRNVHSVSVNYQNVLRGVVSDSVIKLSPHLRHFVELPEQRSAGQIKPDTKHRFNPHRRPRRRYGWSGGWIKIWTFVLWVRFPVL